jgi:tetratricopeptide (TPR) repeat protein
MVAAFQNHPNLADELYWVGRAFGYWERHEEEKDAYQRIIQNYPDNQYADRARLGFAKASVQSLIMSKDYNGAEEALDKMVTDFPEHPDLPESLYWIAERYEWSGRYEDAKRVHQQIIQNFPDSPFVSKAKFGYSKANVRSFIMSQDYDGAKQALDKLIVDFNDNPDLPRTVLEMVEQCYKHADFRRQNTGLDKQAVDDFQKTKDVAKEIAESFHQYDWIVPEARLYMAYCDYQLGQYKEAAQNSQEIAANWPGYEYIHYAQLLIAGSYEKLAETGVISMSEADYQIEQALAAVIEKETKIDKESIARALLELGRWYVKIGEKDLAVNVYEDLIMRMDDPNNPDALAAKAELEKLR